MNIKNATAVAVTLGLMAAAPAAAQDSAAGTEQKVTFQVDGQTVVGTLALPAADAPAPVILLLHGFTGARDEMPIANIGEGVFARSARIWAEKGVASLRIDFRGSGESGGQWVQTTFDGQIKDALAAVQFLKAEQRVAGEKLGVVGWSQGGLVATAVANKAPDLVSVALWNPVINPLATYIAIFGAETMGRDFKDPDAPIKATILGTTPTTLNGAFFQGILDIDPIAEIAGYKGPLFIASGTQDALVTPQPQIAELMLKYHDGPEELWVRDMDHDFNGTKTAEFVDAMAEATLAFFSAQLK